MRRRDFINGIAGLGVAWPLTALAQRANVPVIGFLHIGTADARSNKALAIFRHGLQETGFLEGQNVAIEYRFAENEGDRLNGLAADLVYRHVAVIVILSGGAPTALAAKAATSTVPIVIAFGSDPVTLGLAESLNRPGGNVTGITFFTTELVSKRVELLCEVLPQAKTIAYLRPRLTVDQQMIVDVQSTAHALGRQLVILKVDNIQDLDGIFSTLIKEHADALIIASSPFFETVEINDKLAELTLRNSVPAIYQNRAFPAAGGLMSYGADEGEAYRQAGIYTGRILNGEKPADLPFQQSTKVEFVINLKTAKAFGLTIPLPLLGRADEIIE